MFGAVTAPRPLSHDQAVVSCYHTYSEALISGLVSLGVPHDEAAKYQDSIRSGEFLVVVYGATATETEAAITLLHDTKPNLLQAHSIFHSEAAPAAC